MDRNRPLYQMSVAADLIGCHPQTLRQYERLGFIRPHRLGGNRMFSEADLDRVRRVQRLTQDMGVNLAGVELVLRLQDEMEAMQADFESQFREYVRQAESRMQGYLANSKAPIRPGHSLLPVPNIKLRKKIDF